MALNYLVFVTNRNINQEVFIANNITNHMEFIASNLPNLMVSRLNLMKLCPKVSLISNQNLSDFYIYYLIFAGI